MNEHEPAHVGNVYTPENVRTDLIKKPIWGFWATIGISFIILAACFVADTFIGVAALISNLIQFPLMDVREHAQSLSHNGFVHSLSILMRAPVTALLILLFVNLKKGASMRDYLALYPVPVRVLLVWLTLSILLCPIMDCLTTLFDRPVVPEFWIKVYTSAGFLPLLIVGVVFIAPVVEEVIFRGFMFRGIEDSRLGPVGAVFITTTIWTLIHLQYDWFEMTLVFIIGIFLGVARARTKSIYTTTAIHSLINLIAFIEMAIVVHRSSSVG